MDYKEMLIELLLEKKNTEILKSDCIGKVCMVRTFSAGVFYGEVTEKIGKEIRMKNARRVWYWAGAASLSQLAMEGTKSPDECKFPCPVDTIELDNVIEIIPMRLIAIESLNKVKIWKA